jgi:hypothetical protein
LKVRAIPPYLESSLKSCTSKQERFGIWRIFFDNEAKDDGETENLGCFDLDDFLCESQSDESLPDDQTQAAEYEDPADAGATGFSSETIALLMAMTEDQGKKA